MSQLEVIVAWSYPGRVESHQFLYPKQVQAEVAKFKKGSPVVLDAKLDPAIAKLPGVFTSVDQWNKQAIIIDHKLRAEKTAEWRKWFAENIMN